MECLCTNYVFGKSLVLHKILKRNENNAVNGRSTADAAERQTRQRVSRDHRVCCWLREAS